MPEFNRDYVRGILMQVFDDVDDDHKVQEVTDYLAEEGLPDLVEPSVLKTLIVHLAGFYDWVQS